MTDIPSIKVINKFLRLLLLWWNQFAKNHIGKKQNKPSQNIWTISAPYRNAFGCRSSFCNLVLQSPKFKWKEHRRFINCFGFRFLNVNCFEIESNLRQRKNFWCSSIESEKCKYCHLLCWPLLTRSVYPKKDPNLDCLTFDLFLAFFWFSDNKPSFSRKYKQFSGA